MVVLFGDILPHLTPVRCGVADMFCRKMVVVVTD